jgi:hypothetical protein
LLRQEQTLNELRIHPLTQETIVARSCKGWRSRNWLGPETFVSFYKRAVSLITKQGQQAKLLT